MFNIVRSSVWIFILLVFWVRILGINFRAIASS